MRGKLSIIPGESYKPGAFWEITNNWPGTRLDNPLCDAADQDNAAEAARLLKSGHDVNARVCHGLTSLHLCKSVEMAELLIGAGADVNARETYYQRTPLAYQCADEGIAQRILEAGGTYSVEHIDTLSVKSLLRAGEDFKADLGWLIYNDFYGEIDPEIRNVDGFIDCAGDCLLEKLDRNLAKGELFKITDKVEWTHFDNYLYNNIPIKTFFPSEKSFFLARASSPENARKMIDLGADPRYVPQRFRQELSPFLSKKITQLINAKKVATIPYYEFKDYDFNIKAETLAKVCEHDRRCAFLACLRKPVPNDETKNKCEIDR